MKLTRKKRLFDAVLQDDAARVTRIASYAVAGGNIRVCVNAMPLAIENNKSKALEALLEAIGRDAFYFICRGQEGDREDLLKLFKAAASSSNPAPLLLVFWNANKKQSCNILEVRDFLNKDTPVAFVQSLLRNDPARFGDCMTYTGLHSTAENLDLILAYAPKGAAAQHVLDEALVATAAAGEVEKAQVLLNHNANPDYDGSKCLFYAARNEHRKMVALLLSQEKSEDVFTAVDENTLRLMQVTPEGLTLTTTFNLLLGEQQVAKDIQPETVKELRAILNGLNEKKAPRPLRLKHQ